MQNGNAKTNNDEKNHTKKENHDDLHDDESLASLSLDVDDDSTGSSGNGVVAAPSQKAKPPQQHKLSVGLLACAGKEA